MANTVKISNLNPFRFVLKDLELAPGYHLKHFDEFLSKEQLVPVQQQRLYCTKQQNSDTIYFQIVTNYGPVTCDLIDENEDVVANGVVGSVTNTFYSAPEVCYGVSFDLTAVPKGCYLM
ncbi:MAG TPA: hypothetical protein PLD84_12770, partial [Chitinophagales bacterium]|nr:hypothetical protein [Chitinophagales bacterium]